MDGARSGLEVLVEVVRELKKRKLFPNPKFEIYIDGGVRRATDVIKAIALGATAVGLGRPFIYAYSSYGQEGVEHACQILKDEFTMNMRLLGARTLKEITPEMVDASALGNHASGVPQDRMFEGNCEYARGGEKRFSWIGVRLTLHHFAIGRRRDVATDATEGQALIRLVYQRSASLSHLKLYVRAMPCCA